MRAKLALSSIGGTLHWDLVNIICIVAGIVLVILGIFLMFDDSVFYILLVIGVAVGVVVPFARTSDYTSQVHNAAHTKALKAQGFQNIVSVNDSDVVIGVGGICEVNATLKTIDGELRLFVTKANGNSVRYSAEQSELPAPACA